MSWLSLLLAFWLTHTVPIHPVLGVSSASALADSILLADPCSSLPFAFGDKKELVRERMMAINCDSIVDEGWLLYAVHADTLRFVFEFDEKVDALTSVTVSVKFTSKHTAKEYESRVRDNIVALSDESHEHKFGGVVYETWCSEKLTISSRMNERGSKTPTLVVLGHKWNFH